MCPLARIIGQNFVTCVNYVTWNRPYIVRFEKLQKRGIKWIFNEIYRSYSNEIYFHRQKEIDIMPLYLMFQFNDLIIFHQIVYNQICINMPKYLVCRMNNNSSTDTEYDPYFQRSTRNFEYNDNLKFKSKITPRIDAFRNSFFQRTYIILTLSKFNLTHRF